MTVSGSLLDFGRTAGVEAAAGVPLVAATIPVGGTPFLLAVSPDGSRAYVTSAGTNTVSVIDTATNTVVTTTPVGTGPGIVVMTARNVYVANTGSDTVSVIDI